jgi:hypothetical protein
MSKSAPNSPLLSRASHSLALPSCNLSLSLSGTIHVDRVMLKFHGRIDEGSEVNNYSLFEMNQNCTCFDSDSFLSFLELV